MAVKLPSTKLALALALALGATACRGAEPPSPAQPSAAPPRLLALVVVDQLRGDELARHDRLFRYGLRRLIDEGRWYTRAMHGHANAESAAGHASIATGLTPRYHGVVDARFFDQARGRVLGACEVGLGPCDPDVLVEPTLGDRLKMRHADAEVVALSHKDRSAMLLGGQRADLVVWGRPFSEDREAALGGRAEAGAELPSWLRLFRRQVVTPSRINRIWELPRLPPPYDQWRDDAPGEIDIGLGTTFPHRLPDDTDLDRLYWAWFATPDNDRAAIDTALFVAERLELGRDEVPDLLAVSLSGFDAIGHDFGPDSLERVAALTELDRALGDLLTRLNELSGSRLLVALVSDHGIAPTPFMAAREAAPAPAPPPAEARVKPEALAAAVQEALTRELGPGEHVRAVAFPFIALAPIEPARRPAALAAAVAALEALPAVHRARPLEALATPEDELDRLLAASVYPGRSGDLVVVLEPYYACWDEYRRDLGSEHGSPWPYDRHVPVLLWGEGVTAGRVDDPVAVIDLTRTLADRLGLPADPRGGTPLP